MRATELPERVRELLESAESVGYRVAWENSQNKTLYYPPWGRWPLGGWNSKDRHWYVGIVAVGGQETIVSMLTDSGFRQGNRRRGSNPWQDGSEEVTETFRQVIGIITGVSIPSESVE